MSLFPLETRVPKITFHCLLKSPVLLRRGKKDSRYLSPESICCVETLHKLLGKRELSLRWKNTRSWQGEGTFHLVWYLKCRGQLAGQREPDSSWERVHWADLPSQHASGD